MSTRYRTGIAELVALLGKNDRGKPAEDYLCWLTLVFNNELDPIDSNVLDIQEFYKDRDCNDCSHWKQCLACLWNE